VLMFKDFTHAYEDTMSPLLKKGFSKIESLPSADMDISFNSFDEYLKTLSGVSRYDLRRKLKKVDGKVKIDLEITNALADEVVPRVYELYLETLNNNELGLERVPVDFFKQISKNMPKEVKYFLWRIEGKIVAFAFCLVSGEHFVDYYLGFDYSVAHQYSLFFVRFRDLMNWCIAHGMKKYEIGVTAYEPKKRLRFKFLPLYFYLKHRNKLINPFVRIIGYFIRPGNFDPVLKDINRKQVV
jgi:predicted N-acyltransferase